MDLSEAYELASHIPNGTTYPFRWQKDAEKFRAQANCDLDIPYGQSPREVFDIFYPKGVAKGIIIFIHGGYWLRFDKSFWSHFAKGSLEQGWAVAMPSYDLCPNMRIKQITDQIANAIGIIAGRMSGPIRLIGHSAGAHLVSRMACIDQKHNWSHRVARIMPISVIADLKPLMQTNLNDKLNIDAKEALNESPLSYKKNNIQITIWVGANERPVFLNQSDLLANTWNVEKIVEPDTHHFNIIDGMKNSKSHLISKLLA